MKRIKENKLTKDLINLISAEEKEFPVVEKKE